MSSSSLRGTRLRLVLDTNVVVSGLLWSGHSRRLLELALSNTIALYSSPVLVDELSQTLHYAKRVTVLQTTAQVLMAHYSAMVTLVVPKRVPRVIAQDADDDQILACAVEARAHLIASGDRHLHSDTIVNEIHQFLAQLLDKHHWDFAAYFAALLQKQQQHPERYATFIEPAAPSSSITTAGCHARARWCAWG